MVGVAFSVCFCIGPPIGAWFAMRPASDLTLFGGRELNLYAWPATLTLVLLVAETAFLWIALPETLKKTKTDNGKPAAEQTAKAPVNTRLATLKMLKITHFAFLVLFSGAFSRYILWMMLISLPGVEFTLTFLTFDRELCTSLERTPDLRCFKCSIGTICKTGDSSEPWVSSALFSRVAT